MSYSFLPIFIDGMTDSGSVIEIPERCKSCVSRECRNGSSVGLGHCSYGMNYYRSIKGYLLFGFVLSSYSGGGGCYSKARHSFKGMLVPKYLFDRCVYAVDSMIDEAESEKKSEIVAYKRKAFTSSVISDANSEIKEEIKRGLSFVHDYRQINSQISQSINIIIEAKYDGFSVEDKVAKATDEEKSIYWGSKFLEKTLNVTKYLLYPEWVTEPSKVDSFRFHGLAFKIFKIYEHRCKKKKITLKHRGESRANIRANSEAVGVVVQTLIDNAVKYSPPSGAYVEIFFDDEKDSIVFSVKSLGPKISDHEKVEIFQPFYRGKAAEVMQEEGAGFGLYISSLISEKMGAKISVEQSKDAAQKGFYETEFTVEFPVFSESW